MEQIAGRYGPNRMLVALSHISQVISRVRHDAVGLLREITATIRMTSWAMTWCGLPNSPRDGIVLRAACEGQRDMAGILNAPPHLA